MRIKLIVLGAYTNLLHRHHHHYYHYYYYYHHYYYWAEKETPAPACTKSDSRQTSVPVSESVMQLQYTVTLWWSTDVKEKKAYHLHRIRTPKMSICNKNNVKLLIMILSRHSSQTYEYKPRRMATCCFALLILNCLCLLIWNGTVRHTNINPDNGDMLFCFVHSKLFVSLIWNRTVRHTNINPDNGDTLFCFVHCKLFVSSDLKQAEVRPNTSRVQQCVMLL